MLVSELPQLPLSGLSSTDMLIVLDTATSTTSQIPVSHLDSRFSGGTWGSITGTLSGQTDVQQAINARVSTGTTITINGVSQDLSTNRTFTVTTGVTWGQITGTLTGQTDLNVALNSRASTGTTITINGISQNLSTNRTWTLTGSTPSGIVDFLNVKDYGAVGDGSTNDRTAFQSCIHDASFQGKGVFVPKGTFYIGFSGLYGTTATAMLNITGSTIIKGSGPNVSKIKTPNSPAAGGGYDLFYVRDNVKLDIYDIELSGPTTVDTSTNADVGSNAGTATAPTFGINVHDCTVEGYVRLFNVKFTDKWLICTNVQANSGTGVFYFLLHDCDVYSYGMCCSMYGPDGADRNFIAYNTRFRNSGIPIAENNNQGWGHTLYLHPSMNWHLENCRFDIARRYAIHNFSGGGQLIAPEYARIVNCFFSSGVTEGIITSQSGPVEWIGGEYQGTGNITIPYSCTFTNVNFNPYHQSFLIDGGLDKGTGNMNGCTFNKFVRIQPKGGTWTLNDCYAKRQTSSGGVINQLISTMGTGGTIYVNGGRYTGGELTGSTATATEVFFPDTGRLVVRGATFDGNYNYFGSTSVCGMYESTAVVTFDNCWFNIPSGLAFWSWTGLTSGQLSGTNNYFHQGKSTLLGSLPSTHKVYGYDSTTLDRGTARTLIVSSTLNFGSTAAQSSTDLTVTVSGASLNDIVSIGVPHGSVLSNSSYTGWVSATNIVTVRYNNYSSGAQDPPSGTFNIAVIKY